MLIPEYAITNKMLKNISAVEYAKAIIDHTTILPTWEKQLQKEACVGTIFNNLQLEKVNVAEPKIKKYVDGLDKHAPMQVQNLSEALEKAGEISQNMDLEEKDLNEIHKILAGTASYRSEKSENHTSGAAPDEILAQMTDLFDWYNSVDARQTHPMIVAAILKAEIELIKPFEKFNSSVSDIAVRIALKVSSYGLNDFLCLEDYYIGTQAEYAQALHAAVMGQDERDFTPWVEYFVEGFASEALNLKEKVLLLAKDTKIAKASGRTKLTPRQEKIVEYLQDYGLVRNRDFGMLFPEISEDSVLRDLKKLINEGIVVKMGSTKSSRYELK